MAKSFLVFIEIIPFGTRAVLAVIVTPPAVSLVVEAQPIVGGNVFFRDRRQGNTVFALDNGNFFQTIDGRLDVDQVLAQDFQRLILQLGNAQASASRVVFAVDISDVLRKGFGELLNGGGIDSLVVRQRFFDMVDQRFAADLAQTEGDDLSV